MSTPAHRDHGAGRGHMGCVIGLVALAGCEWLQYDYGSAL